MSNAQLTELEHRLALAEREVEKTRLQLRALQEREWPRSRLRGVGTLGMLGLVLVFAATRALDTKAEGTRVQVLTPQRSVHVIEAPVVIVGKSGKTIVSISEDQYEYGLNVYSPRGDSAQIGAAIQDGSAVINLFVPGRKRVAQINDDGFYVINPATGNAHAGMGKGGFGVNNSEGTVVAVLGTKPNGSGMMSLGTPKGDTIVEAGMLEGNRGIVRAYPIGGPTAGLGLPWAIMGKK